MTNCTFECCNESELPADLEHRVAGMGEDALPPVTPQIDWSKLNFPSDWASR